MMETVGRILYDATPALLQLFAASAVLLAAAAGVARLTRGASAAVRHLVWASALWALLALPAVSLLVPAVPLRILAPPSPDAEQPSMHLVPYDGVGGAADREAVLASRSEAPNAPPVQPIPVGADVRGPIEAAKPPAWSWRARAVALWGGVAGLLLAAVLVSRIRLHRLASGSRRVIDPAMLRATDRIARSLGIGRGITVLWTPHTGLPLTWGVRDPVILLPADAARWPAERRDAVLAHELAHVARGDALGHEAARLAAALYWVNPLVWVALRAIRAERERACDDLVLASGARASSYAADLLEIARTAFGRRPAAAAALAMARPSELEGRLLAILDPRRSRRPASRGTRISAAVAAVLVVVPLGALRPAERAGTAADQPPAADRPSDSSRVRRGETSAPGARTVTVRTGTRSVDPVRTELGSGSVAAAVNPAAFDVSMPDVSSFVAPSPIDAPMLRALPPEADMPEADMPEADMPAAQDVATNDDVATLIAVARAAADLSGDHDKAELLMAVIARAVRDDGLQRVLLRSAATIRGGHERHRVLLALLQRGLVPSAEAAFLGAAEGIASGHERSAVLVAFARAHGLRDGDVRRAYLRAAGTVPSGYARAQALRALVEAPDLDAAAAIDLFAALRGLTSHEAANLLVAVAHTGVLRDVPAREAFLRAAAALSSAGDYRRVLRAAGIGESVPR